MITQSERLVVHEPGKEPQVVDTAYLFKKVRELERQVTELTAIVREALQKRNRP